MDAWDVVDEQPIGGSSSGGQDPWAVVGETPVTPNPKVKAANPWAVVAEAPIAKPNFGNDYPQVQEQPQPQEPSIMDKLKGWYKKKAVEQKAAVDKGLVSYATDQVMSPINSAKDFTLSQLGAIPRTGQRLIRAGAGAADVLLNPVLNAIQGTNIDLSGPDTATSDVERQFGGLDYKVDSFAGDLGATVGDLGGVTGEFIAGGGPAIPALIAGLTKAGTAKTQGAGEGTALAEGVLSGALNYGVGKIIPKGNNGDVLSQIEERAMRGVGLGTALTGGENLITRLHNPDQKLAGGLPTNVGTILAMELGGMLVPGGATGITREDLARVTPQERQMAIDHVQALANGQATEPLPEGSGAATYLKYAMTPGGPPQVEEVGHIAKIRESFNRTFNPGALGPEAKLTEGIMRDKLAQQAQEKAIAANTFDPLKASNENATPAQFLESMNAVEKGANVPGVQAQDTAMDLTGAKGVGDLRQALADEAAKIQALGTGRLENPLENYFGRQWEQEYSQNPGMKPLLGSQNFAKERTFPTGEEAMVAGKLPATTNPVEMQMAKLQEMQRYRYGEEIKQEMMDKGLVKLVRPGDEAPEGWKPLNDPSMKVRQFNEDAQGMVERGQYYAPDGAAQVFNNHFSTGLRGKAPYDFYMKGADALNQAQLGLGAYHAGFVAADSTISKTALGLQKLSAGDYKGGLIDLAKTPTAFPEAVYRGGKVLDAWRNGQTDPVVDFLVKGGWRGEMDSNYKSGMVDQFKAALRDHSYGKAALKAPFAVIEKATAPIMEVLVPRVKAGVAYDMAKFEMSRLPEGATKDQIRAVAQRVSDSVDNRLGQMVYDNQFWNRTAKDVLHASTRSVGWNVGTIKELGGGAADAATSVKDLLANGPKPKGQGGITSRTAYTLALPTVTAVASSIYQYLMSGETPDQKTIMGFPKTGETNSSGNEQRVQLPTYQKDIYAYSRHPLDTIIHKANPLPATLAQLEKNKDFFGNKIRDQYATAEDQTGQVGDYLAKQVTPFSIRNMIKAHDEGASLPQSSRAFFGLVNAPSWVDKTDAEDTLSQMMGEKAPVGGRSLAQAQKKNILQQVQEPKNRIDKFAFSANKLGLPEILHLWEVATDKEKEALQPIIDKKMGKYQDSDLQNPATDSAIRDWWKSQVQTQ